MRVVQKALTFDDVLLLPAQSSVVPRDVNLQTRLTRNITLNMPLLSAAMDTVTESRLAIAIAQEGGLGIVHKNMPPKAQAAEVAKVEAVRKRRGQGPDHDPAHDVGARGAHADPSSPASRACPSSTAGRSSASSPIATCGSETNLDQPVAAIMTKRDKLVTVPEGTELEHAKTLHASAPARARAGGQRSLRAEAG